MSLELKKCFLKEKLYGIKVGRFSLSSHLHPYLKSYTSSSLLHQPVVTPWNEVLSFTPALTEISLCFSPFLHTLPLTRTLRVHTLFYPDSPPFCFPHYSLPSVCLSYHWHGNNLCDTPPGSPPPKILSCWENSTVAGLNWNSKPPVSKAHSLQVYTWPIREVRGYTESITWCFMGSGALWVQCYRITTIFHRGRTWTHSLSALLGIWRYFSLGCFCLLHQCCVHWF